MDWTLILKLGSCVAIFLVCFIGGVIPIRLTKWFASAKTLTYANCLSAGILLGAALIHLLYDAENQRAFDYPFAHLCAGVGFFVAFMLEKVMFAHSHEHSSEALTQVDKLKKEKVESEFQLLTEDTTRLEETSDTPSSEEHSTVKLEPLTSTEQMNIEDIGDTDVKQPEETTEGKHEHGHKHSKGHEHSQKNIPHLGFYFLCLLSNPLSLDLRLVSLKL